MTGLPPEPVDYLDPATGTVDWVAYRFARRDWLRAMDREIQAHLYDPPPT